MDLLKSLQPIPLRTVHITLPYHTSLNSPYPFSGQTHINKDQNSNNNSTLIHIIDTSSKVRHGVIKDIILETYNTTSSNSPGITVIFDLLDHWTMNNLNFSEIQSQLSSDQRERIIVIPSESCDDFDSLLLQLSMIQSGEFFPKELRCHSVSLVIIDGLNLLNWGVIKDCKPNKVKIPGGKDQDQDILKVLSENYRLLSALLLEIRSFYNCSIITTSFDHTYGIKTFSNGSKKLQSNPTLRDELSYTSGTGINGVPVTGYLEFFKHVYYVRKVKDRVSGAESVVGKYFPLMRLQTEGAEANIMNLRGKVLLILNSKVVNK
ncbi:hypothetical protein WICPIJ_001461 [Wickerhamomyces pijperi]|uniref:Uncharacterized protein n=1 Tax=Wickerhamomyces pijperi TaxID=599730 RepID=A0A9P8TQQ3_WICPI|nr:hypothetical protein WICPIJ_001461 [Wickerhamomyces pijperi]